MIQPKLQTFTVTVVTTGSAKRFKTADFMVRGVEILPLSGPAFIVGNATAQASALAAASYAAGLARVPTAGIKWVAEPNSLQSTNLRKWWLQGAAKDKVRVFATLEA